MTARTTAILLLTSFLFAGFMSGTGSLSVPDDWDSLRPAFKSILEERAKHYFHLDDDQIVDRTAEVQLHALIEKARTRNRGERPDQFPSTHEYLAWGLAKNENTKTTPPPMWSLVDGTPLGDPVFVRVTSDSPAISVDIQTVLTDSGTAIAEIHWKPFSQYDRGLRTTIHLSDIPPGTTNASVINGPVALLPLDSTTTYNTVAGSTNTVHNYRLVNFTSQQLTGPELFELLKSREIVMYDWYFVRGTEFSEGKRITAYEWKQKEFVPTFLRKLLIKP